jgi:hypothetical protein
VLSAIGAWAQDASRLLEQPALPRTGVACPSPSLYSPLRPDPEGTPTVVGIAVYFNDISYLSDTDQTITADLTVIERWRDARLADASRGEWSADCPVPGAELWMPSPEPENLRARQQFYPARFLVNGQGVITLGSRQLMTVGHPMKFHDFPFDTQHLRFTIWPMLSTNRELVFHPLEKWVGRTPEFTLQGWAFGTPTAVVSEANRQTRVGTFSKYDVVIEARRDWSYYAWKLGLPLTMIVLMAYTVYWIPPTAAPQQVAIGMTSMLTLIAYMLALGGSLPKISYLTRADRFFVGSALLVFLGLMKAVSNLVWLSRNQSTLVERADRLGRWLYPVGMMVNGLLALVM